MTSRRVSLKVVNVFNGEEARFDFRNNHGHNKSANIWLDIISKINCRMLVV